MNLYIWCNCIDLLLIAFYLFFCVEEIWTSVLKWVRALHKNGWRKFRNPSKIKNGVSWQEKGVTEHIVGGWKAASRLPDATLMTNSASNSSSPPTSQRTHKHMCVSYAWLEKCADMYVDTTISTCRHRYEQTHLCICVCACCLVYAFRRNNIYQSDTYYLHSR